MTFRIPRSKRCLIVGEVAGAHDGSLLLAHSYIDAIADAGADAVKFQCHRGSPEGEQWRTPPRWPQDSSRHAYRQRLEFTEEQWRGLRDHATDRGLVFIVSPFSIKAAEFLVSRVGVKVIKVPSGKVTDREYINWLYKTQLPLLVSTGMSNLDEVARVVEQLKGRDFALLQCTSKYPCPPEQVGLNLLAAYRTAFKCAVGLSDHSGTIWPGVAAATIGCDVLEVHVVMSRYMHGFDATSSITPRELGDLVTGVRFIEEMRANPVNKDDLGALAKEREIFMGVGA